MPEVGLASQLVKVCQAELQFTDKAVKFLLLRDCLVGTPNLFICIVQQ